MGICTTKKTKKLPVQIDLSQKTDQPNILEHSIIISPEKIPILESEFNEI